MRNVNFLRKKYFLKNKQLLVRASEQLRTNAFFQCTAYYFFDLCATGFLLNKILCLFFRAGKKYSSFSVFYATLCYCAVFYRRLYTVLLFFFTTLPAYTVKFQIRFLRNQRHFIVATRATENSACQYVSVFFKYVFLQLQARVKNVCLVLLLRIFFFTVLRCATFFLKTQQHLVHVMARYKIRTLLRPHTAALVAKSASRYFWLKRLRRRRVRYYRPTTKTKLVFPATHRYYNTMFIQRVGPVQQRIFRPIKLFVGARYY